MMIDPLIINQELVVRGAGRGNVHVSSAGPVVGNDDDARTVEVKIGRRSGLEEIIVFKPEVHATPAVDSVGHIDRLRGAIWIDGMVAQAAFVRPLTDQGAIARIIAVAVKVAAIQPQLQTPNIGGGRWLDGTSAPWACGLLLSQHNRHAKQNQRHQNKNKFSSDRSPSMLVYLTYLTK